MRQIYKQQTLLKSLFRSRCRWIEANSQSPVLLPCSVVPPCRNCLVSTHFWYLVVMLYCQCMTVAQWMLWDYCRKLLWCDCTSSHKTTRLGGIVFWFLVCGFLSQSSFWKEAEAEVKKHTAETEEGRKLYFWVYDFTDVCLYVIIYIPYGYSINVIYTNGCLCIWLVFQINLYI